MGDVRKIDTGTDDLLGRVDEGVAVLTMNRPEARNAMSGEMTQALSQCLRDFELDPQVRAIVLTGAGKGFCAGGDVRAMDELNTSGGETVVSFDEPILRQRLNQRETAGRLYKMPKPVLASLPGAAAGAGLALALACDLRIMADTALMTSAFAKVGFAGDYGGTFFLTKLVGTAKAREIYYLSDRIQADEALRLGLTNWVVPADQLEAETMKIARRLAGGPSIAYRYMKENLNRAAGGDAYEAMDLEATHHVYAGRTEDHKNAVKAFLEKKDPVFQGR